LFLYFFFYYYFNEKIAKGATKNTFTLIANRENKRLYKKIEFDTIHPATKEMLLMMGVNPEIYSIYFAHKDDSYYQAYREAGFK